MPAPGDTVGGRFIVEELIGRGGMASVYRVRHTTLGHTSALKVLDLPQASLRDRLKLEGRIQSQLAHPNIVAVTDMIEVDGSPGLVLEYIDGPSLDAWLRSHRPDPATIDMLFRPILDAVAHAHKHERVHRDLKPGNVLVSTVDGRLVPKISDFGLAKLLSDEDSGHKATRTGFAMGTPGYMAPEQIRSAKHVDQRADIFALGAILYELWCGAAPFRGDSVYDMLVSIEARNYPPPRTIRADIPPAVEFAIAGCLEPELERRIPSADALRDMLYGAKPEASAVAALVVQPPAVHAPVSATPAPGVKLATPSSIPKPPVRVNPALRHRSSSSPLFMWVGMILLIAVVGFSMIMALGGTVAMFSAVSLLDTGF